MKCLKGATAILGPTIFRPEFNVHLKGISHELRKQKKAVLFCTYAVNR